MVLEVFFSFVSIKRTIFFSEGMLDINSGKLKRDVDAINSVTLTIEMCKAECQLLSNGIRTLISNPCKIATVC